MKSFTICFLIFLPLWVSAESEIFPAVIPLEKPDYSVSASVARLYDVSSIIDKIAIDISLLNLNDEFNVKLSDYIQPATTVNAPPLPIQPMPSAQILQPQTQAPGNIASQGLTPTELALLSPEEQQIRLRQRGLA